jgi:hypothetical protein
MIIPNRTVTGVTTHPAKVYTDLCSRSLPGTKRPEPLAAIRAARTIRSEPPPQVVATLGRLYWLAGGWRP